MDPVTLIAGAAAALSMAEMISHAVYVDRRDGKYTVSRSGGHYGTNPEEFVERPRSHWRHVPRITTGPEWMPSAAVASALVMTELRKRDPNVRLEVVHLNFRPRYDGVDRDIAWEGAALYLVPDEHGKTFDPTTGTTWSEYWRDFTMRAGAGNKWQVHLLEPENGIEKVGPDETLQDHYIAHVKRRSWGWAPVPGR
jgi:hypothetical protein